MAHKTLIGGTAYGISSGRTLVGGTAYSIDKGKTLVSGTAYTISFLPAIGTALNSCTWADVRAISDAGQAANYFSVGDTKNIVLNGTVGNVTFSNFAVDVFIIGIDHNSTREGANRIHFQIGKVNGTAIALVSPNYGTVMSTWVQAGDYNMHGNTVSGQTTTSWKNCGMRSTILGAVSSISPVTNSLMAALPSDLRAVLKWAVKYTDNVGSNAESDFSSTMDYLWLLSQYEVSASTQYINQYAASYQQQYAYYKSGNSKAKYKHNALTTAADYWTRTPYYNNLASFECYSASYGGFQGKNNITPLGISPAFCV